MCVSFLERECVIWNSGSISLSPFPSNVDWFYLSGGSFARCGSLNGYFYVLGVLNNIPAQAIYHNLYLLISVNFNLSIHIC